MRSQEERVAALHQRAELLIRQTERRKLIGWGSASGLLLSALLTLLIRGAKGAHAVVSGQMTGSSLLDSSMGGYVLVAVIAFSVGVILTAVIRWYRSRDGDRREQDTENIKHVRNTGQRN